MRKVTKITIAAFMADQEITISNTYVSRNGKKTELYLFNNLIAIKEGPKIRITNAGGIRHTKERLNGIPGVNIGQKAGKWYLNGKVWDGKLIQI